jgi:hypothetical protein
MESATVAVALMPQLDSTAEQERRYVEHPSELESASVDVGR